MENVKTQLEEQHAQEVEHLRSYFQQQLKDSEVRYTAEIAHLQDKLRSEEVSSDYTRYNQFLMLTTSYFIQTEVSQLTVHVMLCVLL